MCTSTRSACLASSLSAGKAEISTLLTLPTSSSIPRTRRSAMPGSSSCEATSRTTTNAAAPSRNGRRRRPFTVAGSLSGRSGRQLVAHPALLEVEVPLDPAHDLLSDLPAPAQAEERVPLGVDELDPQAGEVGGLVVELRARAVLLGAAAEALEPVLVEAAEPLGRRVAHPGLLLELVDPR